MVFGGGSLLDKGASARINYEYREGPVANSTVVGDQFVFDPYLNVVIVQDDYISVYCHLVFSDWQVQMGELFDQVLPHSDLDRLCSATGPKFGDDVADMGLDRTGRYR